MITAQDEYIPYTRQVEFYAPFPPMPRAWQWVRPVLCALRVFRPGWFSITLREMTTDAFFEYSQLQIQEVEDVFKQNQAEPASFFQAISAGLKLGKEIATRKPRKLCIATGLDDPAWFAALQPSERRRLEELIDECNPELKKKLEAVMVEITKALLSSAGLTSLISSHSAGTDQPAA